MIIVIVVVIILAVDVSSQSSSPSPSPSSSPSSPSSPVIVIAVVACVIVIIIVGATIGVILIASIAGVIAVVHRHQSSSASSSSSSSSSPSSPPSVFIVMVTYYLLCGAVEFSLLLLLLLLLDLLLVAFFRLPLHLLLLLVLFLLLAAPAVWGVPLLSSCCRRSAISSARGLGRQQQLCREMLFPGATAQEESIGTPLPLAGAGEDKAKDKKDEDDSFFDEHMVGQWMRWRASYPVRGTGGVILTDSEQPSAPQQKKAWHHYVRRDEKNGRVQREWWMPPLLVPFDETVSWVPGGTEDEIGKQCSVDAASVGRPTTHQLYTNAHRIFYLAQCHPQVVFVDPPRLNAREPEERDNVDNSAKTFHQSPCHLHLVLGSSAAIIVACSVYRAGENLLLSLSWYSAAGGGCEMTAEMESLASVVFFDLVEAAHYVPTMYAADFQAASGAERPAAPPAAARDEKEEAPPTRPRGGSGSTPLLGADAPVASSRAAPPTAARALDLVVSCTLGLGRSSVACCGGACRGISGACSGCIWLPPAGRCCSSAGRRSCFWRTWRKPSARRRRARAERGRRCPAAAAAHARTWRPGAISPVACAEGASPRCVAARCLWRAVPASRCWASVFGRRLRPSASSGRGRRCGRGGEEERAGGE